MDQTFEPECSILTPHGSQINLDQRLLGKSFGGIVEETHGAFRAKEILIMNKVRMTSSVAGLALAVVLFPSTAAPQGASDENSKIRAGYALIEKAGLQLSLK